MSLDTAQLVHLQHQLTALQHSIAEVQRRLKAPLTPPIPGGTRKPRARGYWLFGQEFQTRNANETLAALFRHFAEFAPEFPERFRQKARTIGRSRCYVGRTPQDVYPDREQLWEMTAQFAPGWYIGTNENNATKLKLLRVACRVIGLRFGKDVEVRM